MGHEDQLPIPKLSDRYRFSHGTFGRTRGNGRDAPRAAISLRLIAIFGALLNSEFVAPKSTAPDALLRSGDNDFSMLLIGGRGNGCRNQSLFSL
jgi:hypothetical protein